MGSSSRSLLRLSDEEKKLVDDFSMSIFKGRLRGSENETKSSAFISCLIHLLLTHPSRWI